MGRTVSAYFVFCDLHRGEVKAQLLEELENKKVSVAVVAKSLGEKWKQLPDEEKKRYQELAAEKAQQARETEGKENDVASQQAGDEKESEAGKGEEQNKAEFQHPFGFPLNLVKRIMTMDEEVSSISTDALKMTAKSADLIIQLIVAQAQKIAVQNKRKTIKFSDVQAVLMKDQRWALTGVRDLLLHDEVFAEARLQLAGGANRVPKPKKMDPNMQQITSFFKA